MKIAIIVEGKTERAFIPILRDFLKSRLPGKMPRLDPFPQDGRIPKGAKLNRVVANLLRDGSDAVIALTDVYTGTGDFLDARDAKAKMREWVGAENRFYPHAAQHDFKAWLLPYWPAIQKIAGHNRAKPAGKPEQINHQKPPSKHIQELFRIGSGGRDYVKDRDALRILRGQTLVQPPTNARNSKASSTRFCNYVAAFPWSETFRLACDVNSDKEFSLVSDHPIPYPAAHRRPEQNLRCGHCGIGRRRWHGRPRFDDARDERSYA